MYIHCIYSLLPRPFFAPSATLSFSPTIQDNTGNSYFWQHIIKPQNMRVLTLPLLVFMAALAKDVSSADTNPIVTISATSTVTATDMPRFITTTKSFTETETEITTETEVKTKTKTGIKTEIKTGTETETETETTTTVLTSKLTHTTSITVVSKPPRTTTRAYTTTTMTYTTTAVSTATSVLTVTAAQTNVLAMNVHPEAWREVTKPKVENIQWTGCNQCGRSTHDYHLYKSIDFFCKGGSDGQFGGRLKDGLLWPNSTIGLALWVNTTHPREGEIPLEKEKGGLLVRVIVTTFKSYPGNYIDMFHLGRQACIDMLSTVVTGCHLGPDDPHS